MQPNIINLFILFLLYLFKHKKANTYILNYVIIYVFAHMFYFLFGIICIINSFFIINNLFSLNLYFNILWIYNSSEHNYSYSPFPMPQLDPVIQLFIHKIIFLYYTAVKFNYTVFLYFSFSFSRITKTHYPSQSLHKLFDLQSIFKVYLILYVFKPFWAYIISFISKF